MRPPAELAAAVARGDRAAVASAISLVEDRRARSEPAIAELLLRLHNEAPVGGHRVGITGPPGVGKSSLVAALARALRAEGRSLGVLAVDPSSPRSGGALLGDRARIEPDLAGDRVLVRSMASGGDLGGLSRAAGSAIDVLGAAFDVVLVETTGVGQSEIDVELVTETVCFVVQPASGDVLQFLKAGILEIPDIFVVNKADLGAVAERALADLRSALAATTASIGAEVPHVVAASAATGAGVDDLLRAIDAHLARLEGTGERLERRDRGEAAWALRLFERRHGEAAVEALGGRATLAARARDEVHRGALPLAVSRAWAEEYILAVRAGAKP